MKTTTKIFGGMAVLILVLATIGSVSADTIDSASFGAGFGNGDRNDEDREDGLLAEYMEAAVAEGLGLTVEELNTLEADGANHYEIAIGLGINAEEFAAIMDSAQERAVALAAQDGISAKPFGTNGNGQFGRGINQDELRLIGSGTDEEQRGGFGSRMARAEECEEDICREQPLSQGFGRVMEDSDGFGYGNGRMNETCDGETCSEEIVGKGVGRGRRR